MSDPTSVYFDHAQLSMAAYAVLTPGMNNNDYKTALKNNGFTDAQAAAFVSTYSIVTVFNDPATDFSATLFQKIGSPVQKSGSPEKILAIRGTESWRDLLISDLQIGVFGLTNQYASLENVYAQILAELQPADTLTVTGHSLGRFLAQAFTLDHQALVSHTYTYNSPGLGGVLINPVGQLGITANPVPNSLITNLIAQGHSFVSSTGAQFGTPRDIFIETSITPLDNHGKGSITDSLALYDLFAKIDPSLNQNLSAITSILEAESSESANSLEKGLDALRKLFGDSAITETPTSPPGDDPSSDARNTYYTNLLALKSDISPTGQPLTGYTITSLVNQSSSTVYSQAKSSTADGLAYRYALQELNPFAIVGVDYGVHNPVGANGGPIDLYNTQTGHGTMTALFLSDRAELLARKNEVNVNDGGLIAGLSSDTRFLDIRTGFEFGSTLTAANDVIFGDDRVGDAISGRGGDDHLYGGDGADTIEGHDGSDYIEGNAGNDPLLSGGAGNDIILGQQGNDTLDGGADNDRLNGGLGDDTLKGGEGADQYTYFTGQGHDTVNDSDKSGSMLFDLHTLVGGIRRQGTPAETWVSPGAQFTFVKSGTSLVVNNVITIENFDFATGTFGLKLADAGDLTDSSGPPINYANGQPSIRYDGDATDNHPSFPNPNFNLDAYGYGGHDVLDLSTSSARFNHQLFGGAGDDALRGGSGQDRLYGEAGTDTLAGEAGDDVLDGARMCWRAMRGNVLGSIKQVTTQAYPHVLEFQTAVVPLFSVIPTGQSSPLSPLHQCR